MNFENAKAKAKEIWAKVTEDNPETEEELEKESKEETFINTHMNMQMVLLRFILGFAGGIIIIQAIKPEMLTKVIYTIPDGGITFMSMLPLGVMFIGVYMSCDILGKQIIEWSLRLINNIQNKVTVPKILSDLMVPIFIGGYLIYKLYYPQIMSLLTGVR
jgi:hypothetical protein